MDDDRGILSQLTGQDVATAVRLCPDPKTAPVDEWVVELVTEY